MDEERRPTDDGHEDGESPPEIVELPIADVLDLHSFRPGEVRDLVLTYLDEAHARGFASVRIVHGKGLGAQRALVRALAGRDPRVVALHDAPLEAGSWGATVITFRR
ncbi:MAG: Smr/MutS family protein [Thermoanaerobaculia bacterium]